MKGTRNKKRTLEQTLENKIKGTQQPKAIKGTQQPKAIKGTLLTPKQLHPSITCFGRLPTKKNIKFHGHFVFPDTTTESINRGRQKALTEAVFATASDLPPRLI